MLIRVDIHAGDIARRLEKQFSGTWEYDPIGQLWQHEDGRYVTCEGVSTSEDTLYLEYWMYHISDPSYEFHRIELQE